MAGLFGLEDPEQQGLLSAALAMLAASGPSPKRTSVGQVVGLGGIQGLESYNAARVLKQRDEELRRRNALVDMQMQELRDKRSKEKEWADWISKYDPNETITRSAPSSPGDYAPGEAPNVTITQQKPTLALDLLRKATPDIRDDLVRAMFVKGKSGDGPSDVQTAEWYRTATPEQRRAFDLTKRGLQMVAGIPHVPDAQGNLVPLIKPEQVAAWLGEQGYTRQYGSNAADSQQRLQPVTNPDGSLGYRSQDQIRGGPAPINNPFSGARLPSAGPQAPPPEVEAEVTRRSAALQRAAEAGQVGPISFGNVNSGFSRFGPGMAPISRQELPGVQFRPPEEAGPRLAGEKKAAELEAAAAADKKKQLSVSAKLRAGIDTAERLLKMDPTSSDIGWAVDRGLQVFGISVPSSDAASALETVAGWMTSNVPRMEGPQSEYDVEMYKQMAAMVGNRRSPLSARLFALNELKRLTTKYDHLNKGTSEGSDPARDRINELRKQRGLPPL